MSRCGTKHRAGNPDASDPTECGEADEEGGEELSCQGPPTVENIEGANTVSNC